ncbi:hypothetical protein MXB_1899 [Myxobolus squamalis]|nr:hypothetical protein MXB_1899 [Myxobolus squamalis]
MQSSTALQFLQEFLLSSFLSMSLYVPPALHAQSGFLEFAT